MFVICFYFIVFAATAVMSATFFYRNKRVDVLFVLLLLSVMCDSLGRFLISIAENTPQAIWANKLVYVGACFTPLFIVLIMARLCEINIPKPLLIFMVIASLGVTGLTMTVGHSGIYYKEVELAHIDGYGYLEKVYGPAHVAFPILAGVDSLFMIFIMVKAFRQRKKIPFSTVVSICGLAIVVIVVYLLTRIFHSTIEWLSAAYLVAIILFMRLFEHINMYDMITNIATSVERMKEYGFIVFDNKRKFINANELVRIYFPEINDWKTEEVVEHSDSHFYREVMTWYYAWCDGNCEVKIIRVNNLYLELSVRDIVYGKQNKKIGHLVELIDRTFEHKYTATVENYNAELSADVAAKTEHINEIKHKMVIGMAAMVESRDNSTGGHIQRTSSVVSMFSDRLLKSTKELGIDAEFVNMVIEAAPMHDLGKIAVDDAILRKQGKFTDEEYAQMKNHSAEGAKIVRRILEGVEDEHFVKIAENVAHYHHEKWNGTGYPCRLAGEDIPIEARIMALADVFDALVSKRCYKEAFTYDKAFEIIKNDLGTHFDPVLGSMFLECRPELEAMYDRIKAEE